MLTEAQFAKAARLWAGGVPTKQIMHELGITRGQMNNLTYYHRAAFPRRYERKGER